MWLMGNRIITKLKVEWGSKAISQNKWYTICDGIVKNLNRYYMVIFGI